MKQEILAEPVLVGRERELEELQHCLDSAAQGRGTTVLISGEAGTGKTKLVTEFLKTAKQKTNITQLYVPFIEAMNHHLATHTKNKELNNHLTQNQTEVQEVEEKASEIMAWFTKPKQQDKKLENLSPQAWKDLTYQTVTNTLLALSTKKPTVLFLEDLHLADSASLGLLHYLARVILNAKFLIIGTFRSEELVPNAEGQPHPLVEALSLMNREDLFTEIKLPNLNQTNVAELAKHMLGGSLQPELSGKLSQESGGNPLFVVESLRMLKEAGSLLLDNNQWRLSVDELGIPSKIKDIILRRVGMLKPSQKRTLDLAAVIGEKFSPELLATILDENALDTMETLDEIARNTNLVCNVGKLYQFDQAKIQETLYQEISPRLRKEYHSRVAERLESMSFAGRLAL